MRDKTVTVISATRIGSGYLYRSDPNAQVVGPTGLAYDGEADRLYVASTGDNAIYAIRDAGDRRTDNGKGTIVYSDSVHLHGPLGLVLAPNGHLITTNGDAVNPDPAHPSEMVEFTKHGEFVAQASVNSTGEGAAFGIAVLGTDDTVILARPGTSPSLYEVQYFDSLEQSMFLCRQLN